MSKNKMRIINLIIGSVVLGAIVLSYQLHSFASVADTITFMVTVLSLVISFFAFIIAMMTYTSIDSVNVVTQMDGNVLENEDYVTSFSELVSRYNMQDVTSLKEQMFTDLNRKFTRESKTAISFSNNLQYFIDIIVFLPLLFKTEKEKKESFQMVSELLKTIRNRQKMLLSVSLGNLTLIDETVKLIEAVMNYQQMMHTKHTNVSSAIVEVRGKMLKNAVTKTVYYNYLGLYYNKKAIEVINRSYELEGTDLLSIKGLNELLNRMKISLDEQEAELLNIYLLESRKAFKQALDSSQEDKMWEGYIKYNDARTTYFYQLFFPNEEETDWKLLMDEAIIARARLNFLLYDFLGGQKSFIQEEFIYQEYLARLVKININIAENTDIYDTNQRIKYRSPMYEGILDDQYISRHYVGPSAKIRRYQVDIRREVGE